MSEVKEQEFSKWDGTPFFEGYAAEGRHVYILLADEGRKFTAFGVVEALRRIVFKVTGTKAELERFLEQMKAEGAQVTYGAPPFDTKTGGDKPTSGSTKPGHR